MGWYWPAIQQMQAGGNYHLSFLTWGFVFRGIFVSCTLCKGKHKPLKATILKSQSNIFFTGLVCSYFFVKNYMDSKILLPHLKTTCSQNNVKWSPEKMHARGQMQKETLWQQIIFSLNLSKLGVFFWSYFPCSHQMKCVFTHTACRAGTF